MLKDALQDKWIIAILIGGLLIQLLTSFFTIGTYNSDAHFHVIEYSLHQQGLPSAVDDLWERDEHLLPTLKMYMFTAYYKFMNFLGVDNRYDILRIMRILIGLCNFVLFNYILIRNIPRSKPLALYSALIIFCFSWSFPYARTGFSAEMLSSIFFFGGMILYQHWRENKGLSFLRTLLVGLIMSLAFYARFQIAFAGLGFIIYLLFFQKTEWRILLGMAFGFAIGLVANTAMDSALYGELAFTPINYFVINILEGKAASFGTSSVLFYIIELAVVLLAPLLSLVLFFLLFRGVQKYFGDPYVLAAVFFVVAHCFVGHKEDRFLFPVFGVLPLIIGYAFMDLDRWYQQRSRMAKVGIQGLVIFSLVLNMIPLTFLMLVPYSQGVEFGYKLNQYFENSEAPVYIYSQRRTPYQTISLLPLTYYEGQVNEHVKFEVVKAFPDTGKLTRQRGASYICTTYNQLHKDPSYLSLASKHQAVFYSSRFLWQLNEFLRKQGINTISEIWVMYKVE